MIGVGMPALLIAGCGVSLDLIAARIAEAVGIVTIIRRIAVAAKTMAQSAMLMAAMETAETSGHVATVAAAKVAAAPKMTAAETAPASECGS
jgi:hypothetical protein